MIKLKLQKKFLLLCLNLVIVTILFSCSDGFINEDLKTICSQVTVIQKKKELSNQEKVHAFLELVSNLKLSADTRKFLNELFMKSEVSFDDFTEFANKNGLEDWSCDALKKMFEDANQ